MSTKKPVIVDVATYVSPRNLVQVKNAEIVFTLEDVNVLGGSEPIYSPMCPISHYGWYFEMSLDKTGDEEHLSFFLHCQSMKKSPVNDEQWLCRVDVDLKVLNQDNATNSENVKSFCKTFNHSLTSWGYDKFMKWSELTSATKGFRKGDTVVFQATLKNLTPFMSNL